MKRMNGSIVPVAPAAGGLGESCGAGERTGIRGMVVRALLLMRYNL